MIGDWLDSTVAMPVWAWTLLVLSLLSFGVWAGLVLGLVHAERERRRRRRTVRLVDPYWRARLRTNVERDLRELGVHVNLEDNTGPWIDLGREEVRRISHPTIAGRNELSRAFPDERCPGCGGVPGWNGGPGPHGWCCLVGLNTWLAVKHGGGHCEGPGRCTDLTRTGP